MDSVLQKINNVSVEFLLPLSLEKTYTTIVHEAMKLIGGNYGSIILKQGKDLVKVYASIPVLKSIKSRKRGFTYKTYKLRKIYVLPAKKYEKIHPEVRSLAIKSTVFIPLSYKNTSIGVLSIDFKNRDKFKKEELDLLKLFGTLASIAIRKAQLYTESQRALEMRDVFISMATHELRTPLTVISGYVQLLHKKNYGKDSVEAKWIDEIRLETYRLQSLINELLEVNRIRTGKNTYTWKECRMRTLIQESLVQTQKIHPQRTFVVKDLIGEKSDLVIGDSEKLILILKQLLDNAVKFSPTDSPISIVSALKSTHLIVRIEDKGRGIAKKNMPKILEGLFPENNGESGIGAGLFMAKNIVNHHQGFFHIESEEKKGTQVEIQLPAVKYAKI